MWIVIAIVAILGVSYGVHSQMRHQYDSCEQLGGQVIKDHSHEGWHCQNQYNKTTTNTPGVLK